jgi:adenylosuccinate lyase
MITRYTRDRIGKIWSDLSKFRKWWEVELAVCKAWSELGKVPSGAVEEIERRVEINEKTLGRIRELEEVYRHDVLAFVSAVSEQAGDLGRFIHMGITSSDIIDTALALTMREVVDLIIEDVESVRNKLKELAFEHRDTLMMGRTHGVHAEPITLGLKFAVWFDEMGRNLERLKILRERISVGKISGAVGTYSNVDPKVEEIALSLLGLKPESASTQIVHRDRHAEFLWVMAITASSLEKFATEIRHLQRTEVLELQEPFREGQRGSSAMPHKKNPIHSERICGLARLIRSYLITGLENVALWHERDISHSSAERVILPDASIALDYILNLFRDILEGLVVNRDRMLSNMDLSLGLYCSSKVLTLLTERGMDRDSAYDLVQSIAMESWEKKIPFRELLRREERVVELIGEEDFEKIFDPEEFVKNRDIVFRRVFSQETIS